MPNYRHVVIEAQFHNRSGVGSSGVEAHRVYWDFVNNRWTTSVLAECAICRAEAGALTWTDLGIGDSGSHGYFENTFWQKPGVSDYWIACASTVSQSECTILLTIPATPEGQHLVSSILIYEGTVSGQVWKNGGRNAGEWSYLIPPNGFEAVGGLPAPPDDPYAPYEMHSYGGGVNPMETISAVLWLTYEYDADPDEPACDDIAAIEITSTGAILSSPITDVPWEWGIYGSEDINYSDDGIITDLLPDTIYWFRQPGVCSKTFEFRTEKDDDWAARIITLPATDIWNIGATLNGELRYNGNNRHYLYLGFRYGISPAACTAAIIDWLYSGTFGRGRYPIRKIIAGLYPDHTYYFQACLHVGAPPMNVNNYFGSMLSFGGPVSIFGSGKEFITAKKAEDDISNPSVGRYYADKEGNFKYESRFHR